MSGRKVVLVFAAVLTIGVGATITLVRSLEAAERYQESIQDTWRRVALELDKRYRSMERSVAELADDGSTSLDWIEVFRLHLDAFRTSGDLESQIEAANRIESVLAQHPEVEQAPSLELLEAIAEFESARADYEQWLAGPIGRSLRLVVPQSPPPRLTIAK
ncbi:MAG: hypothetical protein D6753_03730 [Planctomycetota bacterium]|nr:MAG: hypothetical protein D6753_03730 [Planctomycetota bacterium]